LGYLHHLLTVAIYTVFKNKRRKIRGRNQYANSPLYWGPFSLVRGGFLATTPSDPFYRYRARNPPFLTRRNGSNGAFLEVQYQSYLKSKTVSEGFKMSKGQKETDHGGFQPSLFRRPVGETPLGYSS
jgi:hypothetical protein